VNKDSTFCISKSCPKADTCDRWWMNNGIGAFENISMFDPYKKGGECKYYAESYKEKYKETVCGKTNRKVVKRKGAKLWKQRKKNTA